MNRIYFSMSHGELFAYVCVYVCVYTCVCACVCYNKSKKTINKTKYLGFKGFAISL